MSDHDKEHGSGEGHKGGGSHGHGPPHGGGHGDGEHEGAPEWLISFADMVMLIMGFFVILLAMNMGPKGASAEGAESEDAASSAASAAAKHADFVLGVREAFNNRVDPFGDDPSEAWLRRRMREKHATGSASEEGPRGDHASLQAIRPTDYNRVTARIAFEDGSSSLSAESRELIGQAAAGLRDHKWIVDVRGHVSPFESMRNVRIARQLSFDRAFAVAQVLADNGVKWENLRVSAAGEVDRVIGRTYNRDKDRANQRVEIVQTDEPVPEDPYSRSGGNE